MKIKFIYEGFGPEELNDCRTKYECDEESYDEIVKHFKRFSLAMGFLPATVDKFLLIEENETTD